MIYYIRDNLTFNNTDEMHSFSTYTPHAADVILKYFFLDNF